jgi:predicted PurR-regulated permease PerM
MSSKKYIYFFLWYKKHIKGEGEGFDKENQGKTWQSASRRLKIKNHRYLTIIVVMITSVMIIFTISYILLSSRKDSFGFLF